MQIIAIVSGGVDSITLAYHLKNQGHSLHLLSFDYGQRHKKELQFAAYHADQLGAYHDLVDLTCLYPIWLGSALTDETVSVPTGAYTPETLAVTVVPNRNAIMTAIAYALASTDSADAVALGVHSGDHAIYPDCRPEFLQAMETAMQLSTDSSIQLLAPFRHMSKTEIVTLGNSLDVPFVHTWSCYQGGATHCGTCSTCVERRNSFVQAGVSDPTHYQGEETT